MKADISTLDKAIMQELEAWKNEELITAFNEGVAETAKTAAKQLKKGGPYKNVTGKYAKGWSSGAKKDRASVIGGLQTYSVYNKKKWQITHLLEKGHQSRNGKRKIPAYEHIAPVNEAIGELAVKNIERKVRG